jgi:hypothetical protein
MHMYPLGDIGVALIGAFCLWAGFKVPTRLDAREIGSTGFTITKLFVVAGAVLLILSVWDLVAWKGAIWQR